MPELNWLYMGGIPVTYEATGEGGLVCKITAVGNGMWEATASIDDWVSGRTHPVRPNSRGMTAAQDEAERLGMELLSGQAPRALQERSRSRFDLIDEDDHTSEPRGVIDDILPPAIEAGSVVHLKSGGPLMTVSQLSDTTAVCMWFVTGHVITYSFPVDTLNLASQEQLDIIRGNPSGDNDHAW
jgi:uncharacterized protein YodC (DUF2158 family)